MSCMNKESEAAGTLRVADVERFATKDGPGIRTCVFLKGCPLHCPWCSNPEAQSFETQLLCFEKKCTACGLCLSVCPNGARIGKIGEKPRLDRTRCVACGSCAEVCPAGALRLSGKEMSPDSLLRLVLRDKDYYDNSGGGVTVSGGEPFAQPHALGEFLALCKAAGLHTAVETCGVFSAETLKAFGLPYVDLFLFDIKSAEKQRLSEVTGACPELIESNLRAIVGSGRKVVARVPVIPGFNHSEESMRTIFRLALSCGVKRLDLLPYHRLSRNKYSALGLSYPMGETPMLSRTELLQWQRLALEMGLCAKIGG